MSPEGLQTRGVDTDMGGTMRLGAYTAKLSPNSHVAALYGANEISERHRHRYEVNGAYRDRLEKGGLRSEEHTSELQSLMRISYAVFCFKKKNNKHTLSN